MIINKTSDFSHGTEALGNAVGTIQIGDSVDLGIDPRDERVGDELYAVVLMDTDANSAAHSATARFMLVSDAQAAIATDGSATIHFATAAIAEADLPAGRLAMGVALPAGTYEHYLGVLQITGGEGFTAGKVTAFLTKDPSRWIVDANAVNA